jgi:hypothetical protein
LIGAQRIRIDVSSLVYSVPEARVIYKPTISGFFGQHGAFDAFSLLTNNRLTLTLFSDGFSALWVLARIFFLCVDQSIELVDDFLIYLKAFECGEDHLPVEFLERIA